MTMQGRTQLRSLEGHRVNVSLADGSRIDDCQLISTARNRRPRLWLYTNGQDLFVALDEIADVWEAAGSLRRPHSSSRT